MKPWYRLFGLLLGIAATIAFVVYAVGVLRGQDLSKYLSISAVTGIVIAALCYSLIIPMSALSWRHLLRDMGIARTWTELGVIIAVTQLAKYIPGNVGQHVGRAAMSVGRGIPPRPYGVSVVVETVLVVLAAALIGVAGCGLAGVSAGVWEKYSTVAGPSVVILACGFVITVVMGRSLISRLLRGHSSGLHDGTDHIVLPRNGTLAFAFVIYVLNYAVLGVGITIMVMLLLPGQNASWLLLTASFALAWVIGFFAPGVPAGLGVREGLMLALLQFAYNQSDALLIVVAVRLATTLGDVLSFMLGVVTLFISGRRSNPEDTFNYKTHDYHET